MSDPITGFLIAAAVAGKIGQANAQSEAADERSQALDLEGQQRKLAYQQKTLSNYALTEKILQSQSVMESTRGVALNSPSFEAIQSNTFNVSQRNQQNADTEESIYERNVRLEKDNVRSELNSQLFGDAADLGLELAGVGSKMPVMPSKNSGTE